MALASDVELQATADYLNYYDVSVDGEPDFPASKIFDDSEQGRAMLRLVYRPDFH